MKLPQPESDERRISGTGRMRYVFVFLISSVTSCVDPYFPPEIPDEGAVLVVEGFINAGEGPTEIHLSRTVSFYTESPAPELDAKVFVEGQLGISTGRNRRW